MKTKIFVCLTVCISTFLFGACSNDDDDSLEPSVKMRLTSLTGGYINISWGSDLVFSIDNIKYDNDGRVISYQDDGVLKTISYNTDKIVMTEDGYNQEYEVVNGRVVSDGDYRYSYDSNGYIEKISSGSTSDRLIWADGNLTQIYGIDSFTYEYSNKISSIANIYNLFFSTCYIEVDPMLALSGYFGKMPKNLLETQYYHEDGKKYFDRRYEYQFNSNGYPTLIRIIDDEDDVQEYTLTWSEVK